MSRYRVSWKPIEVAYAPAISGFRGSRVVKADSFLEANLKAVEGLGVNLDTTQFFCLLLR